MNFPLKFKEEHVYSVQLQLIHLILMLQNNYKTKRKLTYFISN